MPAKKHAKKKALRKPKRAKAKKTKSMKKETQPMHHSDWEPRSQPETSGSERQYGERNPQPIPMGPEHNPEEDQNW
ncbi:MAG: hypothetical protein ACRDFQ_07070 [Anaerolineales bacterium]